MHWNAANVPGMTPACPHVPNPSNILSLLCLPLPAPFPPLHSPPALPSPRLQVRHELEQGHSVRYLLPDAVICHIYDHGLYGTTASAAAGSHRPGLLRGGPKVDPDAEM